MLNDAPRSFDKLQVGDKKGEQEYLPVSLALKSKTLLHQSLFMSSVILWSHEYKRRDLIGQKIKPNFFEKTFSLWTSTNIQYLCALPDWKLILRDEGQLNLKMCDLQSFVFRAFPLSPRNVHPLEIELIEFSHALWSHIKSLNFQINIYHKILLVSGKF